MPHGTLLRDLVDLIPWIFILFWDPADLGSLKFILPGDPGDLGSWGSWILVWILFIVGSCRSWVLIFCYCSGFWRSWILNFCFVLRSWRSWLLTKWFCRGIPYILDIDILFCRRILRILDLDFWLRHMSDPGFVVCHCIRSGLVTRSGQLTIPPEKFAVASWLQFLCDHYKTCDGFRPSVFTT